jgi:linoleoyl-CoA desaturase
MTQEQETAARHVDQPLQVVESGRRLKFGANDGFQVKLRRRVEDYFRKTGLRQRDCWQMYVKTAILLACFAGAYVLLVFVAQTWWQGLSLAILFGLAATALGFNVQHDGGHQSYSSFPWINRLMAMTLELIGGSSYVWRWKHGVVHHTYVNITRHDTDIDVGFLGRLTPHQQRYRFHRWQHFYLWPLYGLLGPKWQFYDDFHRVITGRIGQIRFPRPRGWALAIFLGGKASFLALAFAIPLLFHSPWVVLLFYGVAVTVMGMVSATVFQLAHCVEQAEFPLPRKDTGRIENAWAIHQVETTVDFARGNRVVTWLLGGLNFQIEHHLFPRICHVNYPAISKLVEQTCRECRVKYKEHKSLRTGLASHYRWLRRMGRPSTDRPYAVKC